MQKHHKHILCILAYFPGFLFQTFCMTVLFTVNAQENVFHHFCHPSKKLMTRKREKQVIQFRANCSFSSFNNKLSRFGLSSFSICQIREMNGTEWTEDTTHQSPELKWNCPLQFSDHSPYLSGHVAARQSFAQGTSVVIKVSVGVQRNILGSSESLWVTGRTLSTEPAGRKTHSDWNRSVYISASFFLATSPLSPIHGCCSYV